MNNLITPRICKQEIENLMSKADLKSLEIHIGYDVMNDLTMVRVIGPEIDRTLSFYSDKLELSLEDFSGQVLAPFVAQFKEEAV